MKFSGINVPTYLSSYHEMLLSFNRNLVLSPGNLVSFSYLSFLSGNKITEYR